MLCRKPRYSIDGYGLGHQVMVYRKNHSWAGGGKKRGDGMKHGTYHPRARSQPKKKVYRQSYRHTFP